MNGSWGYEAVDANTFAGWGVGKWPRYIHTTSFTRAIYCMPRSGTTPTPDLLKNDWCYNAGDSIEAQAPAAFRRMRDALNATGRRIIYSIHGKGGAGSGNDKWPTYYADAPAIANSWRMGGYVGEGEEEEEEVEVEV